MKQTIIREQYRKNETADRLLRKHRATTASVEKLALDTLRIVPLGGQNGIGEKNMIVVEYNDDAVVLDCGFELGLDLPGVNCAIPVVDYLESIKHKLRGYVISHGHMDHIGALVHVVPSCPAPIIGSRFTIGMVLAQFEKAQERGMNYIPDTTVLDMDTHEQLQLGALSIELVRVTHSVPESSAIVVNTPAGRLINTGDFRLDPEPLDTHPSDIARLRELGEDGVLLLMSESTNATSPGRTPTEHTLQDSFDRLIAEAPGRIFISIFSTNMNRIQMIINAAVQNGRKVALDGRSMLATAELAVRLGNLKIPKGTLVALRETTKIPDNQLVVVCTGGQGEPGAAMSRMAAGEHQYIKLKQGDSVVISSTPIPGNERSYQQIGDELALIGVTQFRHPTHTIDGCGPLHVSGHGNRDEHAEMMQLTQPNYLMPIYGGALNRNYHRQVGIEQGLTSEQIVMAKNGEVMEYSKRAAPHYAGTVATGARLVDQNGEIVPELVVKDRVLLKNDGFVVASLTVDRRSGRLISSPDIITRGAFSIRDNAELMDALRKEIRQTIKPQVVTRPVLELAKKRLKDVIVRRIVSDKKGLPLVVVVVTLTMPRRPTASK